MSAPARLYDFLSSRKVSVVLTIYAIAMLLIWLFPFQVVGVPRERISEMANDAPLTAALVALIANNVFCMAKEISTTLRRVRLRHEPPEDAGRVASHAHPVSVTSARPAEEAAPRLRSSLARRGYRVRASIDGLGFHAVKGRCSPWGTIAFHSGFLLLVAAALVGRYWTFEGEAVIAEGQSFYGRAAEYMSPPPKRIDPEVLPSMSLRVERIMTQFWRDQLLFTQLTAQVAYPATTKENEAMVSLGSPLALGDTQLAIKGFGYAPSYVVTGRRGEVVGSAFLIMNVFPPGTEDSFRVGRLPYKFVIAIYPDYVFVKGKPDTRTFNLRRPLYSLRVVSLGRSGATVWRGYLRPTQAARFGDYSLSFPEVRKYGEFRIQRNHAPTFAFLGVVLGTLGLALRFLWRRRDVLVRVEERDGGSLVSAAGISEYYPRLFRSELARMLEAAVGGPGGGPE